MTQDNTGGGGDANSKPESGISAEFNGNNELAAKIAKLSPAGLEQAKLIAQLGAERLEKEREAQQRAHGYRVLKAKVELLENYVRDQAQRPEEARANPEPDLQIIAEQAERNVTRSEAYFQREIERSTDETLRQIIEKDRQGEIGGRSSPDHDIERE